MALTATLCSLVDSCRPDAFSAPHRSTFSPDAYESLWSGGDDRIVHTLAKSEALERVLLAPCSAPNEKTANPGATHSTLGLAIYQFAQAMTTGAAILGGLGNALG